jgi:glycosyltransferase involved in cell wall biosynthesis
LIFDQQYSPLVSVCCITFKHAAYIKNTLEGFLIQETNFEFEVNICDDCSPDETMKIVIDYIQNHTRGYRIKYCRQDKNLGMTGNGLFCLNKCTSSNSKYIALCEGDDYWTDPNKLQKQVDFLEANPDYAICFHAVNILENGKERPSELNKSGKEETYSILDLANGNIMHTPSVVFRNGLIEKFPDWFSTSPVGDYVLHLLNAKKGLIKYLPDTMAVYRVHSEGTWGQKNPGETHSRWINFLHHLMEEDFAPQVIEKLSVQKHEVLKDYIVWALQNNQHELIIRISDQLYAQHDIAGINMSINILLQYITASEGYISDIQKSRTYKLSRKLSRYKSFFLKS